MRIEEFSLEGNDGWPDLRANALTSNVHVFCGPSRSGKSTVAGFLGHVLYGRSPSSTFGDSTSTGRLQGNAAPPEGELIASDSRARYRLRRYNDVAPPGRLTVSSLDGATVDRHTVSRLLSGMSPSVLSRLYYHDFRQSPPLDWLLSEEFAREFRALTGINDGVAGTGLERTRAAGSPGGAHSVHLESLLQRREALAARLEQQTGHHVREGRLLDERLRELDVIYRQRESQRQEIENRLRQVEAELSEVLARLRYYEVEAIVDHEMAGVVPADLEHRLDDLDEQITRWRETVAKTEHRESQVRTRLAELHPDEGTATPRVAGRQGHLAVLRRLLIDFEGEVARLARPRDRGTCNCQEAHTRIAPLLEMLDRQIASLEQSTLDEEIAIEFHDLEAESRQLARTRGEVVRQLEQLLDRRESLLRATRPVRSRAALRRYGKTTGRNMAEGEFAVEEPLTGDVAEWQASREALEAERNERYGELERLDRGIAELKEQRTALSRGRAEVLEGDALDGLRDELRQVEADIQAQLAGQPVPANIADRSSIRASDLFARMTAGEFVEIRLIEGGRRAEVVDRHSRVVPAHELSSTDSNLLYLSLSLAVIAEYAQRDVRLPLVLDEPFVGLDDRRQAHLAGVLDDFTRYGHQLLIFTSSEVAISRLRTLGGSCHDLRQIALSPGTIDVRPAEASITTDDTTHSARGSMMPQPTQPPGVYSHTEAVTATSMSSENAAAASRQPASDQTDLSRSISIEEARATTTLQQGGFHLLFSSEIDSFPALGAETGLAFTAIGIRTVDDLLEMKPEAVAERLDRVGISADVVRVWQTHVALMCCIPRVSLQDAQVLTGAGISSPDEVAEITADALEARVMEYLRSERGRRFRDGGYSLSRREMTNWTRDARQHRSEWSRHRTYQRWSRRMSGHDTREDRTSRRRTDNSDRSPRVLRTTGDRDDRTHRASDGRRSSTSRHATTSSRTESSRKTNRSTRKKSTRSHSTSSTTELRFYLNRSSDVEEAPSIGPKTAERLAKVGIHTVDDLLQVDAVELSRLLEARHIKADTIEAWKQQATLVCQVPMLRGHDAQILVACELLRPDDIAKMNPRQLLQRITPFCDSKEGERILRSGAKPDLAEVTDWIRWAGQHRTLEAA